MFPSQVKIGAVEHIRELVNVALPGIAVRPLPVYLPASPEANRPAVPVAARSGPLTSDTFQLQREARGGATWVKILAYSLLGAIVALWLVLTAASLRALEGAGPEPPEPRPAGRRELAAV